MSQQLITASYNDAITINFTSDAWFNATEVAKNFGKRPNDWLNLDATKEYISELTEIFNYQPEWYLKTQRGKHGGGTWFHPKVAVAFARWLNIKFAVWCDMQIEKILHPLQSLDSPAITKAQQGILFNRVKAISGGDGKMRTELWSRFQNHFKLNSYLNLPSAQFDEALVYLDAKLEEYRDGVEMVYLSSKELEQRIQTEAAKALPPPVKEGELASAANTIDVNLKFPDGLRQIAFKFNTEGFHDGRWCMTLSDGNVIIRMMDQNEMAMTFDKWINYAQQERGYVVIKKADVVHKLLA